jgi:hypothetical protein
MVVSNEGKGSKYTHADWEAAKQKRDARSYAIVRHLLAGRIQEATAEAEAWKSWDDEMERINDELE